jgi:uncharacterized membrane protein (UPF0127 family)
MMRFTEIINKNTPLASPLKAGICDSFLYKLRGLMFYPSLATTEGLIFIEKQDSKINSSIHMFFMNFDIGVVWLNHNLEVADLLIARRWRPAYFPSQPACYTLEIHLSRLSEFHVGDTIAMKNV